MWKAETGLGFFSVSSKIKPVEQKQKPILGACVETGLGFFSVSCKINPVDQKQKTLTWCFCGNRTLFFFQFHAK